jgi:hypothetical protein
MQTQHMFQSKLRDVDVYVLGVDGAGKSASYWQGLRQFWTTYFLSAGAAVRSFSVLRTGQDP